MTITIGSANVHLLILIQQKEEKKKGKKILSVIGTHRIYSLNNFPIYYIIQQL